MTVNAFAAAPAVLSASQLGLLNYVQTWSGLSLSSARLEPESFSNLPSSLQMGLRHKLMEPDGMNFRAAASYVDRAVVYERSLLKSLGLDETAVESFSGNRLPFGDYFEGPLYSWQDDAVCAGRLIAEIRHLHDSLDRAFTTIAEKKRMGNWHLWKDERVCRDMLRPVYNLKDVLVTNVAKARFSLGNYGATEEGLLTYFGIKTPRKSGAYSFYLSEEEMTALETINPPPAA